jgi:hypothetical protein
MIPAIGEERLHRRFAELMLPAAENPSDESREP